MKTSFIVALAASMIDTADAGLDWGLCEQTDNMKNLDISRYSGRWYEYTSDISFWTGTGTSCVTADYGTTYTNGNEISVINRAYYWPLFFVPFGVTGAARCDTANGACRVSFGRPPKLDGAPNYNILYTDYDNYSVVYSCRNEGLGLIKQESVWVLSRTPYLPADKYEEALAVMDAKIPNYQNWMWRKFTWQGDLCDYTWGNPTDFRRDATGSTD